jgi:hypothetical protein
MEAFCYNYTWRVPPPEGCEGRDCHGELFWQMQLEVTGANFNVGNV